MPNSILKTFLLDYQRPVKHLDDDNDHIPLPDAQWLALSLTAMFTLQMKVLCRINVLLRELIDSVELLFPACTYPHLSPISSCPPPALLTPDPILTLPCLSSSQRHYNPIHSKPQHSPWPPYHTVPCKTLVPVKTPHPIKTIPAKPLFICSWYKPELTQTKDNMHPLFIIELPGIITNWHQCGSSLTK